MDGTKARRDAEFAAASSKHEVDQLQAKWAREDLEDARATVVAARRLDDLQRRLYQLEQTMAALPGATGEAIAKHVKHALDHHPRGLSYAGVHDPDRAYQKDTLITCSGSLWISLTPIEKDERPGKSVGWKLVAKAGSAQGFA